MESMVDRLVEIEEKAKSIVELARQEEARLPERIEKLRVDIERTVNRDTERIVKQNRKREEIEAEKHLAKLNSELAKSKKDMLTLFQRERKKWANEIFNKVIG